MLGVVGRRGGGPGVRARVEGWRFSWRGRCCGGLEGPLLLGADGWRLGYRLLWRAPAMLLSSLSCWCSFHGQRFRAKDLSEDNPQKQSVGNGDDGSP